jgi:hypothetical protein
MGGRLSRCTPGGTNGGCHKGSVGVIRGDCIARRRNKKYHRRNAEHRQGLPEPHQNVRRLAMAPTVSVLECPLRPRYRVLCQT